MKIFLGKVTGDVMTPTATTDDIDFVKNFWNDDSNYSNIDMFKYLWLNKNLRNSVGGVDQADWTIRQNGVNQYNPIFESASLRDKIIFGSLAPQVENPTWISNFMSTWKVDFSDMFQPLFVNGRKYEVMSYFLWDKHCSNRVDILCRAHDGAKKLYVNYIDDVRTALNRIF